MSGSPKAPPVEAAVVVVVTSADDEAADEVSVEGGAAVDVVDSAVSVLEAVGSTSGRVKPPVDAAVVVVVELSLTVTTLLESIVLVVVSVVVLVTVDNRFGTDRSPSSPREERVDVLFVTCRLTRRGSALI